MIQYMKFLLNKIKEYEKCAKKYDSLAKNPFLQNSTTNPFNQNRSSFYDRTYIWVEKEQKFP